MHTSPTTCPDLRRSKLLHRVVLLAGAGGLLGALLPAAPTAGVVGADGAADCRLVQLQTPAGVPWGTVADIERVQRRAVYFGTHDRMGTDGEWHPQAVVWRGLRSRPTRVGPRGTDGTIALELTRNGLVHGISEDWDRERSRFWVQDLDTGALQWWRTDLDGRRSDSAYIRRVNRHGEATGAISPRGSGTEWAIGLRSPRSAPFKLRLPGRAVGSAALGLNDRGDRAGYWMEVPQETDPVPLLRPAVWDREGRRHSVAVPGLEAEPRAINDRRQMAGAAWVGSLEEGHIEGAFWASPEEGTAVGLLPGGDRSQFFGLDRHGRAVGWADSPADPADPMADPFSGTYYHNVVRSPGMPEGTLRVLPSLHGVRTGETDWRGWHSTHAAHASHAGLDQVGAGTHAGFAEDGTPIGAPTVFLNASQCGVAVPTSHDTVGEASGGAAPRKSASDDQRGLQAPDKVAPCLWSGRATQARPGCDR
jgi:hypothetical protein